MLRDSSLTEPWTMKKHDTFEKQFSLHREICFTQALFGRISSLEIIVPFYSKDFALRLRWRSVIITDSLDKAPQRVCFMMYQLCVLSCYSTSRRERAPRNRQEAMPGEAVP
jgi:hypothetical protein